MLSGSRGACLNTSGMTNRVIVDPQNVLSIARVTVRAPLIRPHPSLVCPLSELSLFSEVRSSADCLRWAPRSCVVPKGSLIFRSRTNWEGWRGQWGSLPHPFLGVWFMQPCWLCCPCQMLVQRSSISQQLRILPEQNEGAAWEKERRWSGRRVVWKWRKYNWLEVR